MQSQEEENKVEDPTLLLVTGCENVKDRSVEASSVKKLAHALTETVGKHGAARLKCVGAASVNKAVKAQTIANIDCEEGHFSCVPEFGIAKFDNGEVEKTAIILVVTKTA